MKFRNLVMMAMAVLFLFSGTANAAADDELKQLFEQFQTALRSGSYDDVGSRFYSHAFQKANDECRTHSRCEESDDIFLESLIFTDCSDFTIDVSKPDRAILRTIGFNTSGNKKQFILWAVFEDQHWKIDKLASAPVSWR